MTADQIVKAYRAVHELHGMVLPYRAARDVARLKRKLDEEMKVIVQMEQTIVGKYKGKTQANGSYQFETPAMANACKVELDQFNQDEAPVDLPMVDLSEYADQICISAGAIEALEGLITFEGSD